MAHRTAAHSDGVGRRRFPGPDHGSMPTDLILGTAGHIDHGKTALIMALTGVDTDRLPEEKKRGITIELGFAALELGDVRLGIVDVPGHERFVRNMLAGATGIDLALLVVAADDSVKQQTREHLEILRLLDLRSGVVVLTKCDVADPEWTDLVELEVRDLVQDTFLSRASIIRTSAMTGQGLDELRVALERAANEVVDAARSRERTGPFRMAIDRSFSIEGHGTVVTGSVQSGQATIGETLVIEPGRTSVRVRSLENHDRTVESIHRGQRAAINLAGVRHDQIGRGQELATPGHLIPSTLLTVRIELLSSAPRPLKNRARLRLHLGTAELMAFVVFWEVDQLEPGKGAYAQLYVSQPAVTTWSQPFVVRSESPMQTMGGGLVLDPNAAKIRRGDEKRIRWVAGLASEDPMERASAALYFSGWRDWQPEHLARTAGILDTAPVVQELSRREDLHELPASSTRTVRVHGQVLEETMARVESVLEGLHEQHPLNRMLDRAPLAKRFEYVGSSVLFDQLLKRMVAANRIVCSQKGVALVGQRPQLSSGEQQLMDQIIERFRLAGFRPPTLQEVQSEATKYRASVRQLIDLASSEGNLVRVNAELFLHSEADNRLKEILLGRLSGNQGLTLSQIREILDTTRKYAVPICEYLDRIGFTRREGDLRVLALT